MRKVAIFGANGNLGRHMVDAFTKSGWQVRAVTRDGTYRHAKHGTRVETASADAMNRDQVIKAAQGCDFIFNALNPPYPKWTQMCMTLSENIIAAARQHQCLHLFPGNVYNYGTAIDALVSHTSSQNPDIKKGKIRVEMEECFEKAAEAYDVQTIVLRGGDFLGGSPSGTSWFELAISKKLNKGKLTYPGPMDMVHSWAYLPDFADAFVRLAECSDQIKPFDAFLFEGHAVTGDALKKALEQICGRPLKTEGIPWPLLKLMGIVSPMMREVCEMSYLWRAPHQMDNSRLKQQLGDMHHTPLVQALSVALSQLGMGELVSESEPTHANAAQLI